LDLKTKWGYKDPRTEMKNCDICANDVFRDSWKETGLQPRAFTPPSFIGNNNASQQPAASLDQEALIQAITDRVLEQLRKAGK
jgi:L-fuculose-phosphate aldolase